MKRIFIVPSNHTKGCRFRLAATCAIAIACEHGYDVCPKCDPCKCRKFKKKRGAK